MHVNGSVTSGIYFMHNYFLKKWVRPKIKGQNCICEKGGVNSNCYFVFCFLFYFLCFQKKNSKSLTSSQGFTNELKRIKQVTKRREGRKSEEKKNKRERKI